MAVNEQERHRLYQRLEEVMGDTTIATTLMEHLPPTGWADVATRHDLDQLAQRMDIQFTSVQQQFTAVQHQFSDVQRQFAQVDRRFEQIDRRFEQVDRRFEELRSELRRDLFAVCGLMTTLFGAVIATIKL